MRGRLNLNKQKFLSALKKCQNREIHSILGSIEDFTARTQVCFPGAHFNCRAKNCCASKC
jgi:hypothetical protein